MLGRVIAATIAAASIKPTAGEARNAHALYKGFPDRLRQLPTPPGPPTCCATWIAAASESVIAPLVASGIGRPETEPSHGVRVGGVQDAAQHGYPQCAPQLYGGLLAAELTPDFSRGIDPRSASIVGDIAVPKPSPMNARAHRIRASLEMVRVESAKSPKAAIKSPVGTVTFLPIRRVREALEERRWRP